jgi:hypothetical protein
MLRRRKPIDGIVNTSVILMLAFFALGMGTFGEKEPSKIPEPDDDFSATVIDQGDLSSEITLFSLDGQTFISGRYGGATVSIPFGNIQEMDFYAKGSDLFATVVMRKRPQVELKMDKDVIFYGQLPYGLFSIKIGEVKKIIITGFTKQER